MSSVQPFPVKKAFLYSLIASVILSATLGIIAILSGRFGWIEVRVILTTVTVSVASICGLACGAYLGTNAGRILPLTGIVLTLLAAALIIAGLWMEVNSEEYWKLSASISVFAIACAHLSLLSMARLANWFHWSLVAAHVIIFGVASSIVVMIFLEINDQDVFQLLGVAAIVDAAITILVPIFHRLSRPELEAHQQSPAAVDIEAIDEEIAKLKNRITELEKLKSTSG